MKRLSYQIIGLFCATRLALFVLGHLTATVLVAGRFGTDSGALTRFVRWDAIRYMNIARNGYSYIPGKESDVAFFPLFPMLVRGLHALGLDWAMAGFLLSNVALLAACFCLVELARKEGMHHRGILLVVTMLLVYPASVFHSGFYSEGLFLFLSCASIVALRRDHFVTACIFGGLAASTRPTGVLLAIPLGLEAIRFSLRPWRLDLRALRWKHTAIVLVPAGIGAYATYLHYRFGDALLFLKIQRAWGRRFSPPWVAIREAFNHEGFYTFICLAALLFLAVCIVAAYMLRLPDSYTAYALAYLFVLSTSSTAEALPRLVSGAFPIYLVLGRLTYQSETLRYSLLAIFSMFLATFTILFANGYWMV